MVEALGNGYALLPLILAIFYAGELVWRDRDRRMHEIIDATGRARLDAPGAQDRRDRGGAAVQHADRRAGARSRSRRCNGYFRFEIGGYLAWFVWPMAVAAILLAVLAVFVQVLVPQQVHRLGA